MPGSKNQPPPQNQINSHFQAQPNQSSGQKSLFQRINLNYAFKVGFKGGSGDRGRGWGQIRDLSEYCQKSFYGFPFLTGTSNQHAARSYDKGFLANDSARLQKLKFTQKHFRGKICREPWWWLKAQPKALQFRWKWQTVLVLGIYLTLCPFIWNK